MLKVYRKGRFFSQQYPFWPADGTVFTCRNQGTDRFDRGFWYHGYSQCHYIVCHLEMQCVQTLMSTFMLGSPTTDGRRGSADRESLRSCAYCCRPTSRIWNRSQNPAEPTNDFYRTSLTRNTERGFLVENGSEMRPVACLNPYLFQLFYLAQPKRVKVVYELYIYVSSILFFWCP